MSRWNLQGVCNRNRTTVVAFIAIAVVVAHSEFTNTAQAAEIFSAGKKGACNLVIMGPIESSDGIAFARQLTTLLREGCASPRIHLYSQGGNLGAAMKIGDDIHHLQLTTVAPLLYQKTGMADEMRPRNGPRICHFLPGSAERDSHERAAASEYAKAVRRAFEAKARPPEAPRQYGDYDPTSGRGDPRCSCASACFFIWAAGSERRGDVVEIHRPIFDPEQYAHLNAEAARLLYQKLMTDTRKYLDKVGVPATLIERMYSVDSSRAIYLTADDLSSLEMMPYWEELKIANCGPEPKIEAPLPSDANWKPPQEKDLAHLKGWAQIYARMQPHVLRHLKKKAEREVCWLKWLKAEELLRKPLIDEYLKTHP
jgi:hypothetical protein